MFRISGERAQYSLQKNERFKNIAIYIFLHILVFEISIFAYSHLCY